MLHGAVDTMFASDLTPERVMDLVPVRPMAGAEQAILQMQRERRLGDPRQAACSLMNSPRLFPGLND